MHRFTQALAPFAARILALAPILALAACNSGPSVSATNASVAEVAAKAQQAIKLQPGEWSTKTEVLEFDMPGMKDPRMAEMMKGAMKQSAGKSFTYCITPEEASKPPAEMFAGKDNGECRFDNFAMAGGRMDSKMTCKARGSGTDGAMTMVMSGAYTPTSYDATVAMNVSGGMAHGGAMTMKAKTSAARIGDCKPGAAKPS